MVLINDHIRIVKCSRWMELSESMKFNVGLSRAASAPSEIRTLNSAHPLLIGTEDDFEEENREKRASLFSQSRHIKDVVHKVKPIITDGEAYDGDNLEAMKPLDDLHTVVLSRELIRSMAEFCRPYYEQKVVDYWYYSPALAFIIECRTTSAVRCFINAF